jgi:hypothetical protein
MPLLGRRLVTLAWAGKIPRESQRLTGSQKLLRIWNKASGMRAFGSIAGFDAGEVQENKELRVGGTACLQRRAALLQKQNTAREKILDRRLPPPDAANERGENASSPLLSRPSVNRRSHESDHDQRDARAQFEPLWAA